MHVVYTKASVTNPSESTSTASNAPARFAASIATIALTGLVLYLIFKLAKTKGMLALAFDHRVVDGREAEEETQAAETQAVTQGRD